MSLVPLFKKIVALRNVHNNHVLTSRVDSLCDLNDAHGWTSPSKTGDSIHLIQKFKPKSFVSRGKRWERQASRTAKDRREGDEFVGSKVRIKSTIDDTCYICRLDKVYLCDG